MTRMTGPDCAVMCNLINIHTYIHTQWNYWRSTPPSHLRNVCMYGHHIYIKQEKDQPSIKVVNPARGQLNRENEYSPVPVRA